LQPDHWLAAATGESDQFSKWGAWGSNPEPTD
jgi:hypothetical protein